VAKDPTQIPDAATFRASYSQIVKTLRDTFAEVVVTTIPDPIDTAYFSSSASVARLTRVQEAIITGFYGLAAGDTITRNGLSAVGNQFIRKNIQPLDPQYILKASVAADMSNRVKALNDTIRAIATEQNAVVYDLAAYFHTIHTSGATVGTTRITGDYFGGFFSLDGYYPGTTGHALIANDLLAFLNRTYGKSFPLVNVPSVLQDDATTKFTTAREPNDEGYQLQPIPRSPSE
jgi:hypothetical protein